MPLWALALLFLLVPIAELYVIYQVGDAIGVVWTFLLLAADSLLGTLLLRSQGRAVWQRFNDNLAQGRMPHREVLDGVLVIFGGAFLITPGFLTDIVGLTLLIPPTRSVIRRFLVRRLGPPCGGGRRSPRLRRRGQRARVRRASPARGSSRERSGARAVLLRRGPRHSRDVAGGRDDPVRGPQAARAPRGAERSSGAARAGTPSCRTGSRSSSSR